MIDRTIPYYNIIMRCDRILPMEIKLPEGYRIRTYQPGDENAWADMECAIGEFTSLEAAIKLFTQGFQPLDCRWLQPAKAEFLNTIGQPAFKITPVEGRRFAVEQIAPLLFEFRRRGCLQRHEARGEGIMRCHAVLR